MIKKDSTQKKNKPLLLQVFNMENQSQKSQDIQKLEESANQMMPKVSVINTEGYQVPQIVQESRLPISWPLMILNVLGVLASCGQNAFYIFGPNDHADGIGYLFVSVAAFNVIVCTYTSCHLAQKYQMFQLYFLLDNMLLVYVAAVIGFISFSNFRSDGAWLYTAIAITFPVDFFLLIGNYRVMLVRAEWSKWKIILSKANLLVCCIMFFQIGVYFISENYSYTNSLDPTFDGQMKQLMLLNVFGTFSLVIEMYSKMTDLDHTGELQSKYQLKQFNDNQLANGLLQYTQLLRIRQEAQRENLL